MSSTREEPKDANGLPWCEPQTPLPAITSSRAIGQMLRTGRRLRDKHVSLVIAQRGGAPGPRLALVVPRRSGNAVKRNRIRRILREQARLAAPIRTMPYDLALCWKGPILPGSDHIALCEARRLLEKFANGSHAR